MRIIDIDFEKILLNKKSYKTYKNILIYDIYAKLSNVSCCCIFSSKKIDEFIKIYDGSRYLLLFVYGRYNAIYNRIKYLISEKSDITDSINHSFARIRID